MNEQTWRLQGHAVIKAIKADELRNGTKAFSILLLLRRPTITSCGVFFLTNPLSTTLVYVVSALSQLQVRLKNAAGNKVVSF